MKRISTTIWIPIVVALLHIHLHHRFHGPPFDYAGLALAAGASWFGLPGPGEPVLLAAAILAARHRLDLATVVGVAFLAATAGGILGWAVGLKFGRAVITGRGPLRGMRVRSLERGEALFERRPVIAILVTPALVAGIHRVPSRLYQPINAASAAVWSLGIGIGGYFAGPPVLEVFSDLGAVFTVILLFGVVIVVGGELLRRRRRRAAGSTAGSRSS